MSIFPPGTLLLTSRVWYNCKKYTLSFKVAVVKIRVKPRFTAHIDVKTTLNGARKVRKLRVSQRFGYIFLQTDKPLYNPREKTVHIRFMATDAELKPANRTYRLQVKVGENREGASRSLIVRWTQKSTTRRACVTHDSQVRKPLNRSESDMSTRTRRSVHSG